MKESGRSSTAGGGHARLRIAELAVALVMLAASGLLLRSFEKMRSVGVGFHTDHTLTATYSLPRQQYSRQAAIDAFNVTVRTKLEQLPGIKAVGVTSMLPAAHIGFKALPLPRVTFLTRKPDESGVDTRGDRQLLQAQGIPVIRGRDFTPPDREGAPLVVIVNRTRAEHYWPGQYPIGKRLSLIESQSLLSAASTAPATRFLRVARGQRRDRIPQPGALNKVPGALQNQP